MTTGQVVFSLSIKYKNLDIWITGQTVMVNDEKRELNTRAVSVFIEEECQKFFSAFNFAGLKMIREMLLGFLKTSCPEYTVEKLKLCWTNGPETLEIG